jgi:16S rRNA (guanine1207-N2)-methyltransferase
MALLDELPFVLPPDMASLYRAAWPSSDLLAEVASPIEPNARVLLLGCAADPLALVIARRAPQGECLVADDDAAAGDRLAQLTAKARLTNLHILDPAALAIRAEAGETAPCDLALANAMFHPSKSMTLHLLRLSQRLLRPDAPIYVAGAKQRGMPSITEEMGRLFGNVSTPLMRKGHRVALSLRGSVPEPDGPLWPDPSLSVSQIVTVRDQAFALAESPLIFASGQLDPAAAMLAEAMQVSPGDTIIDLGCGSGIVGLLAARLAAHGHVYLLDASHASVRTALVNAERNGIGNVTALAGDAVAIMQGRDLHPNVIVTNPPFHVGQVEARQTAVRFISSAAARLAPEGRLYVVANRFLAYEPIASAAFDDVHEVAGDARYKVLLAQRPRPVAEPTWSST